MLSQNCASDKIDNGINLQINYCIFKFIGFGENEIIPRAMAEVKRCIQLFPRNKIKSYKLNNYYEPSA
jgi:hypothetical protein